MVISRAMRDGIPELKVFGALMALLFISAGLLLGGGINLAVAIKQAEWISSEGSFQMVQCQG